MANLDAFSAQIVRMVREMPDEAILELVKHQLGAFLAPHAHANGSRLPPMDGRPKKKPDARGKSKGRGDPRWARPIVHQVEREQMLDSIEQMVRASSGLSASEVAESSGIPQARAAAALKELKLAQRIYQGGDRRFARYASDAKLAEQASLTARKNASGPTLRNEMNRSRSPARIKSGVAVRGPRSS